MSKKKTISPEDATTLYEWLAENAPAELNGRSLTDTIMIILKRAKEKPDIIMDVPTKTDAIGIEAGDLMTLLNTAVKFKAENGTVEGRIRAIGVQKEPIPQKLILPNARPEFRTVMVMFMEWGKENDAKRNLTLARNAT
jgi:hypothetical protein